ncbi:MAG TPA: CHAD domain-containing protein, partial [Tepidisphaeraceae bacterium]|nr:CHAD domain-containing protein [Tepidisphaeraceae bacterium]
MPRKTEGNLVHYIDDLARSLKPLTESAFAGRPRSIHHARVTTRRLRAAMELISQLLPSESTKPFARTLRKLRRRLGSLRDTDVILDHLDEMNSANLAKAAVWLTRLLKADRRNYLSCLTRKKLKQSISGLRRWHAIHRGIRRREGDLARILHSSAADQLAAFARQAHLLLSSRSAA